MPNLGLQALSDTHALGWAEQAIVASTDAGKTWDTPEFNDSAACNLRGQQMCEAKTGYGNLDIIDSSLTHP